MLGEKDLIFLGAALIWAVNRKERDFTALGVAVSESKKLFEKVFNDGDKEY